MRTLTLLAALALVLNILTGVYTFFSAVSQMKSAGFAPWMLDQGTWIIAEGCMAAFYFALYARQKD